MLHPERIHDTIIVMNIILIGQIIVSVVLIALIIPQGQGGGLGTAFGGSTSYHTRRGLEKSIFGTTIITAVIFTGLSIASLF
jgi:protein translocase SecG subunit